MDLNESSSLIAIENLFDEFFNPYTSNSRKHEIEVQLMSFKNAPHLWKMCLYFLSTSSNQYVTMFSLQTLESVINQQWSVTDWAAQEEIKAALQDNLIFKSHTVPHFLRNKYAKLLVDIAKHDWPNKYPNFFETILELLKSEERNQLIGLILLRTTCEEFMGLNSNFDSCSRKKELTRLLHNYIPIVFELLTNVLEKLGSRPQHAATATPPPSPTHPSSTPNLSEQLTTATFRPDHKALTQEALNTVQFMFAWVPVEQIPSRIIAAIFAFTNVSTYAQDDDDICVSAMSAINEIFYRKCSPPGSETFFREIYDYSVELLRNVVNTYTQHTENCDEEFVKKLCELLVLMIEQHLCRFEKDAKFSALEFLSLLFQFTMHLPSMQCYVECLTVWNAFFKQINQDNAKIYSEVFLALGTALLKKIQYTHNSTELNHLNNTEVDEDNKTEWHTVLGVTLDVISKTTQYAPVATFNQIHNIWNGSNAIYRQIESTIDMNNFCLNLEASGTERLVYILKDFATLCHTLAALAHNFYLNEDENIDRTITPAIFMLIDNTLQSITLSNNLKLYNIKVQDPRLTECFIDVHSELLALLKTWLPWMDCKNQLASNTSVFLYLVFEVLRNNVPPKIANSAAHLLLELSRKPNNLNPISNPTVAHIVQMTVYMKFQNGDIVDTINSAICEILLKQMKTSEVKEYNAKKELLSVFLSGVTQNFKELGPVTGESRVQEIVSEVLPSLSHIIEYCRGFPVVSKKELTNVLKPILDQALILFPTYVKYTEVHNHFTKFFISLLKNLQSQIGVEFTKNAIQIFLQVAVSEQQANNLSGLQQLLEIFSVIVRESGNKTFLPDILQLCMESIYPLLRPQINENPDIFATFLDLLYSILNYRWLYFYNSQVMLGYSPGCNESEVGPDVPKRPEQLLAILKVFGEALLQDDINIFRRSLIILQDLNHNKKIYHKAIFRTHLLRELLNVLLQTLLYKRQGLSCEDIIFCVYSLAEVDFDGFFSTFLPQFVHTLEGITPQKYEMLIRNFDPLHDRDVPSFMQHLQNFATEFQSSRKCSLT